MPHRSTAQPWPAGGRRYARLHNWRRAQEVRGRCMEHTVPRWRDKATFKRR
jgi:hypothetical protein